MPNISDKEAARRTQTERSLTTPISTPLDNEPVIPGRQALPNENVKSIQDSLIEDRVRAETAFMEAQKERGTQFNEQAVELKAKAIKIGDQKIAEKQLANLQRQQEESLNELVQLSGIKNQQIANQFKLDIQNRMAGVEKELMRRSYELARKLEFEKMDAQNKQAFLGMLTQTSSALTGGLIAKSFHNQKSQMRDNTFAKPPTGTLANPNGEASFAATDAVLDESIRTGAAQASTSQSAFGAPPRRAFSDASLKQNLGPGIGGVR